jgi:SAM-dependent methyltransferase
VPQIDLRAYGSDKIESGYMPVYAKLFQPLVSQPVALLELGIFKGESLRLWRDYFPRGTIVGLDIKPIVMDDPEGRIHVYRGAQEDTALLSRIAHEHAAAGFDIIIDDASHLACPTRIAFWHLFEQHLKPGGIYVIEDWGTGYWGDWPDGAMYQPRPWLTRKVLGVMKRLGLLHSIPQHTHSHGMVGLVKELVDEQGAADLTRRRRSGRSGRRSKFKQLLIVPGMVVVIKADLA